MGALTANALGSLSATEGTGVCGGEPKLSNIQRQSGRRHQERSPRKSGWSAGIRKEFHWREMREEGSGKQTGPEGKARIGVTSAETELGYSRKQTGEPRPEPKGLCSGRSESGLGSGRLSLLPWEISSFKVGPGMGIVWAQILRRDVAGCQRQTCGSQPPFCPNL